MDYSQLNCIPQKSYIQVLTSVCVNVTSFGDTVFADYEVKMRSERVLNPVMGDFIKRKEREILTYRHRGETHREEGYVMTEAEIRVR